MQFSMLCLAIVILYLENAGALVLPRSSQCQKTKVAVLLVFLSLDPVVTC